LGKCFEYLFDGVKFCNCQGLATTFCHEDTKKTKARSLFLYFSFASSKNFKPSWRFSA